MYLLCRHTPSQTTASCSMSSWLESNIPHSPLSRITAQILYTKNPDLSLQLAQGSCPAQYSVDNFSRQSSCFGTSFLFFFWNNCLHHLKGKEGSQKRLPCISFLEMKTEKTRRSLKANTQWK